MDQDPSAPSYVDLFWLPLGAGDSTGLVRHSGRAYEALSALRDHRDRQALYHSALEVTHRGTRHVIEMTPTWGLPPADRGVVTGGAVGLPVLGRLPLFRYEVHCWREGAIADRAEAVGGARRVSADHEHAHDVLGLAREFPPRTWGRDEQGAGEMWNSNSLTSWLLARSHHDVDEWEPPGHGRAPGWAAGVVVASRQMAAPEADTCNPLHVS